ncbi:tripartite ATP-independent periplasmic transporter, DctQ component family protein 11 [Achromobacter xylosoxidans A8]|uniref:TRAP transporter small permease protein n=1 Tax=Achromobacter xylosoxidans (strain A8) TaxID=762376 RepID=E3HI73_ACHXA|nr:TRAP transporter small permease [Achromobacter xylosoxidans]ADP17932.1 tripartite ATP-independent periplasmic transporter, DctQ component family protein 11 [Achromobacter xylosoxidans A8]
MTAPMPATTVRPAVHATSGWRGLVLRADRTVCWIGRLAVALTLAMILVFCFAQVLDRYLLKTQFDAWDQVARIGMLWCAFVGAAMALRERRNVVIDIIDRHLPERLRRARDRLFDVLLLALAATLFYKGLDVVAVGNFQDIVGTPFTYAVSYASLTVGMVFFMLFLALRLLIPNAPPPHDAFAHDELDASGTHP